MGAKHTERIQREIRLYKRYDGEIDVWTDYVKPAELDYDPTQLTLKYPRVLVDRIAAWQFEAKPRVTVTPDVLDDPALMLTDAYTPSNEQLAENSRAKAKERLLTWVWEDNDLHGKLLKAAKDRAISETGVYARLHYDKRTGGIRVFFHPSVEVIPVYDPWDIDKLDEIHFIAYIDEDLRRLWKLSYYLVWKGDDDGNGTYDCEIEEGIYHEYVSADKTRNEMILRERRVERQSMDLSFIPVVPIPTESLSGQTTGYSELAKMIDIADEIDRKISDYSDALRFNLFAITLLTNVEEDPKNPLKTAPSAKWNLGSGDEHGQPDAKNLESNFKFKEAIDGYLDRLYEALHTLSEVPTVNTPELKVGGLNDVAIHLLFSAIISKTNRAWITWQAKLGLLNEYILRYMKARKEHPKFKYDRKWLDQVDEYYGSTIIFNLPLPEDSKALIEQLTEEIATNIESIRGAIVRSGKGDPEAKFMEILAERDLMRKRSDPYALDNGGDKFDDA